MKLSRLERLLLSNQLRILEALYPEEAGSYAQHRKAIEEGYALHYDWLTQHLYDEMSEAQCQEVIDILDMYRALTFSATKVANTALLEHPYFRFRGFDGNYETKQMGYAGYFIEDLGRFQELRYGNDHADLNSHMPTLGKYRNMLAEWARCSDKYNLSTEDMLRMLNAERASDEH